MDGQKLETDPFGFNFSRSTECHNQDKVSMGTIAVRDASSVIVLTEQVIAALCCASVQAHPFKNFWMANCRRVLDTFKAWVLQTFDYVVEDRPLQQELQQLGGWPGKSGIVEQ